MPPPANPITEEQWNRRTAPLESQINYLSLEIHGINVDHGFWEHLDLSDTRFYVPEKIALIHTEATEVIDADRELFDARARRVAIMEECADIIIRTLDLAHVVAEGEESFGKIMMEKIQANRLRPRMHGKRW